MITQLHTTLSKLKTTYYLVLINWADGVVCQKGKTGQVWHARFHAQRDTQLLVARMYQASVTISDPLGNSETRVFSVSVK